MTVWHLVGYNHQTEYEHFTHRIPDHVFPQIDAIIQTDGPFCYRLTLTEAKNISHILGITLPYNPYNMDYFVEGSRDDE